MERTKYDGKLTDALIQTVVEAENRLSGLIASDGGTESLGGRESLSGQPDATVELTLEAVEASRLAELADYQRTPKPTPTEQAEAWGRNHRDYVPESVGGFDPDGDTE